jgi:hypothetical protein
MIFVYYVNFCADMVSIFGFKKINLLNFHRLTIADASYDIFFVRPRPTVLLNFSLIFVGTPERRELDNIGRLTEVSLL